MKKKALSLLFCILLLAASVLPVFAAPAKPLSAGLDALRDQFTFGVGPSVNGLILDYCAFAPDGDGKYPLVVWLHGFTSGSFPGRQITRNDLSYWTSAEFQARFPGGAAYVLLPRSNEVASAWGDELLAPLKGLIDNYIAQNAAHIDTTRIYLGGLSMGGKMTYKMAARYPNMFAALFPCSPYMNMSDDIAGKVKNIPIWQLSSKADTYMSFSTWIRPDWNQVMAAHAKKDLCRWTVFDTAVKPDGSRTPTPHDTWYAAGYDMFTTGNTVYSNAVTYDGNGNTVTYAFPDGMISWLCRFTSSYHTDAAAKTNTSWFYRLYTSIISFFNRLARALGLKGVLG